MDEKTEDQEEFFDVFRKIPVMSGVNSICKSIVPLGNAVGNIVARGAALTNFGTNSDRPLNLTLKDGSVIRQGGSPITLKETDMLHVVGKNNRFIVNDIVIVDGAINFAKGAELTIEFWRSLNAAQKLGNPI